ncbi:unnamed protein product [Lathyrus oleraceus]
MNILSYNICEKLKLLKQALRNLNKEVFGILNLELDKAILTVNELENLEEEGKVENADVFSKALIKVKCNMWQSLEDRERSLHKKSKQKWIKEGDSNSKFFHRTMKQLFRKNKMVGLLTEFVWTGEVQEVKKGIRHHFESSFNEPKFNRPNLDGVELNMLSLEDRLSLKISFEEEEVKTMVWQSANDKSRGPDGFNMNFYKAC